MIRPFTKESLQTSSPTVAVLVTLTGFMIALLCCSPSSALDKADTDPRCVELVEKATTDLHRGKYSEGLIAAENALKLYPSSRWARVVKALCLRGQKNYERSDEILLQLIKEDPFFPEPHLHRATGFIELGRSDEALEEMQYYGRFKGFDAAFHHTAALLINLKRFDEAQANCLKYLKRHPDDDGAQLLLAVCYVEQGKFTEGLKGLDSIKHPGKTIGFHPWRAYCLANLEREEDVRAELKKSTTSDPTEKQLLVGHAAKLRERKEDSMVRIYESVIPATRVLQEKKTPGVSTAADRSSSIKALEGKVQSKSMKPDDWSELGALLWQSQRAKEAVDAYSKYLEFRKTDAEAFLARAKIYHAILMDEEAVKDCTRAIELEQRLKDAYKIRAACFRRQGRIDDARADLLRFSTP